MNEKSVLEEALMDYFRRFRVNGTELPKRSTVEMSKSLLKTHVLNEHTIDISKDGDFPKFSRFWKGFVMELKAHGKADVRHNREVPDPILAKIYTLLSAIHDLMTGDPNDPTYDDILTRIPEEIHDKFHFYAQYGCMMIIMSFFARRGREGMADLKISDFEIITDDFGNRFYRKNRGELSKNHRTDSEDLDIGGLITFEVNAEGLSPGLYMKDFIGKLNKNCEYIFQRPARASKLFDIKSNPDCW